MKKLVSGILVVIVLLSCVACGGGGGGDAIVGDWKLDSINMGGIEVKADAMSDYGMDAESFSLKVEKSGKFSMTVAMGGMNETADGTWKKSGDKYVLTVDGADQDVTLSSDGKTLTFDFEGVLMNFKK